MGRYQKSENTGDGEEGSFVLIGLSDTEGIVIDADINSDVSAKLLSFLITTPEQLINNIKIAILKDLSRKGNMTLINELTECYKNKNKRPAISPEQVFNR